MNNITNTLSDLIIGNPFTTPIGGLVEESTEDFVGNELYELFSQVCNAINHAPTGPRDAVRALRRRFSTSVSSNEKVAMHTLLLLEWCVHNCGYRFHIVLGNRDAIREFAKYTLPSTNDVPNAVRQKLLSLIKAWSTQFSDQVDLREFVEVYNELKTRGVQFPSTTTQLISSESKEINPSSIANPDGNSVSHETANSSASIAETRLVARRSEKLQQDLARVRINICVLSDLISEAEVDINPSMETKQLISDIAKALYEMSRRLVQAISYWETYRETASADPDAVLVDMINVNDELQTVLLRYGRFMQTSQSPITSPSHKPAGDENASLNNLNTQTGFSTFVGDSSAMGVNGTENLSTDSLDSVPLEVPESDVVQDKREGDVKLLDIQ